MNLDICTIETASEEAKSELQQVRKQYGFIPNLMGMMGNSPSVLKAYLSLGELFSKTTFAPMEQQIILLTVSVSNRCEYCVAAHSMAARMQNVPADVVEAIRDSLPLADPRLEALRSLTEEIVMSRGWPLNQSVNDFLAFGFTPQQMLEVILGVAMKTLSNYTNHIASTPLDSQFSAAAWSTPAESTN